MQYHHNPEFLSIQEITFFRILHKININSILITILICIFTISNNMSLLFLQIQLLNIFHRVRYNAAWWGVVNIFFIPIVCFFVSYSSMGLYLGYILVGENKYLISFIRSSGTSMSTVNGDIPFPSSMPNSFKNGFMNWLTLVTIPFT